MVEAATARARRVRLRAAARAALSALAAPLRVARLHLGVRWHGAVLCLLAAPCAAAMRRAPRPLALAPRHAGRCHTRRVDLVWAWARAAADARRRPLLCLPLGPLGATTAARDVPCVAAAARGGAAPARPTPRVAAE
eukprot:scaffold17080_cov63-Phaeocystis_antarctica.AAC.1